MDGRLDGRPVMVTALVQSGMVQREKEYEAMAQEIEDAIQHLRNAEAKESSNKKAARAELVQAVNLLHAVLGLAAVGPDIGVEPPTRRADR